MVPFRTIMLLLPWCSVTVITGDILVAEVIGLRGRLQCARSKGFTKMMAERDSKLIIEVVQDHWEFLGELALSSTIFMSLVILVGNTFSGRQTLRRML